MEKGKVTGHQDLNYHQSMSVDCWIILCFRVSGLSKVPLLKMMFHWFISASKMRKK